jgi:signal transduction histidine kinase/ActR/RegA family two-component response regulator
VTAPKQPWWRGPELRPDVAPMLERVALERMRVFAPIAVIGILVALVLSVPAGVPEPLPVVLVNLLMASIAGMAYLLLRADRIPGKWAHAVGAVIFLVGPINTLSSYLITGEVTLVLLLMIELATAALLVDTWWALGSTLFVLAAGMPLSLAAGGKAIYPLALCGIWTVAIVMQVGLRRALIRAETHRLDVEYTATKLAYELDERRRAEAERERLRDQFVHAQRMDAVGTLSAGLAHDMNNILGGILAFAEVLYAEATDKHVRADLARIRQEAERGAQLTRSLLAFSRRGQYRRRPILLHSVLDDMTPLLSRTLGRNIKIERTDGPPTIIEGDPAQLGQVLLNLCLNASDAMAGNGTLTIHTDEIDLFEGEIAELPPGRYAKLEITDTGTGMDAETKRRAFEPFFTTKPVGKGTGLGLAMVFGAVQSHGGSLTCLSELGVGTTMTIYLPASEANPTLPASSPAPAERAKGVVLVVDDEPVVRAATARLVQQLGLDVATAADGDDAIKVYRARKSEIVLVLLDMVMPRLPGPACYRELRKLGPTPVLLVSGFASDVAAQELLDEGADGFLEKPYTAEQLRAELDRLLGPTAGSGTGAASSPS